MLAGILAAAGLVLAPRLAPAQRVLSTYAGGAVADHRVTSGGSEERNTGLVWGFGALFGPLPWVEVRVRAAGGQLDARTPSTEHRRLDELDAAVLVLHGEWLAFGAGSLIRTYSTPLARQRWMALKAVGETRLNLIDGSLRGVLRGAVLPAISVTGSAEPRLALGMGTGVEYVRGRFAAEVSYSFERYDFPRSMGDRRAEQLSVLWAQVGWQVLPR